MQLRNALACPAAGLIASISANLCYGQAAPQSTGQTDQLQEVVVTGVRKSIGSALDLKKVADQIEDSIVAEDIGKLPDNNVIEALQHVPGVQISRNAAEADQLLIRGLPDIETLLNGREIFTSTGRFVDLQDIPAELLSRVDVVKSPTAADVAGGIAGVVDVRLHRPFDFNGFEVGGTAMATHSSLSDKTDPQASLLLSNRWNTSAGEFGVLADVSYSKDRYKEEILDNYISSQPIGPVAGLDRPGRHRVYPPHREVRSPCSATASARRWICRRNGAPIPRRSSMPRASTTGTAIKQRRLLRRSAVDLREPRDRDRVPGHR